MAIKSVKVKDSSGKERRVQIGSKAYSKYTSAGATPISGTGKNLTSRDIKGVQDSYGGYQDEMSTTQAKREANDAGELLPYQQYEENQIQEAPVVPQNPQVASPTLGGAQAMMQGGAIPSPQATEPAPPPSPYQTGLSAWQSAGTAAPTSAGAGRAGATQYAPPAPVSSPVDQAFAEDPFYAEMQTLYQEYSSPKNQRDSLTQEYSKLVKKSGIDELDTELMDMRNVIDGTEDDIRNEVTKAGGFATDSQVMAMTNSRNKVLIKNFNNLLELREQKQAHIDTLINLSKEDRQIADQRFDRMFDITGQIADYQMKMKQNATASYERIIESVGWSGLQAMTGGNPYYTSLIEKTMGLSAGGLASMASQPDLNRQIKQAQLQTEYLQQANIRSQIDARNNPTEKPLTQKQLEISGYLDRLKESDAIISDAGSTFTGSESYLGQILPNPLKSESRQQYEQAQRNFINAVLRRESGATITDQEFGNARQQYFPMPGDAPKTVEQKARTRATVINSFSREIGGATSNEPIIGPDGNEYIITD